jgi:tyrosyl-DNA phosphodiesterase 2
MIASTQEQTELRLLEPQGFDPIKGAWAPGLGPPPRVADRLTLVTYNLWFGEHRWEERLTALLGLVRDCRPDVIGFQEVTPWCLEHVLAEDWVRRAYQVSDADGSTLEPHGVLLLSRLPIRDLALCHLPSEKDRKLVLGELETVDGCICAGTVHLESSPPSVLLRLEQLDRVLPWLSEADDGVLMGDFNFDPRDTAEQSLIEPRYRDLWPELHGDEPGYTVDTRLNRMRLQNKGLHKRARFDRILLRSRGCRWAPASMRIIGTGPLSPEQPDLYPSDHFGLAGVIVRRRLAPG